MGRKILGGDVLVVGQHGHHDGLDGGRHEEPGVLADLGDGADEGRVAGEEGGPVAGEVGLLGQGVQGQEPGRVGGAVGAGAARARVQEAGDAVGGPGLGPGELGVALVGGDDDAAAARL